VYIKTSNRAYEFIQTGTVFGASDPAYASISSTAIADMDANDTAYVYITQNGGAAQTDVTVNSWFAGYLAC
jgi:hypothetical protein